MTHNGHGGSGLAIALVTVLAGCASLNDSKEPAAYAQRYLGVVRAYADAMLAKGRDTYGAQHSPVFASALDRRNMALPDNLPPIEGIRKGDRSYEGGNPMHDECFYQLLYDLSRITGDRRYGREADAALRFFLTHAQSPATGLFAWGEHMYWDFASEAMGGNDTHEIYRPWALLDTGYRLAPDAMTAYARGLWLHQIANHEHGYFSRHATWSKHAPHGGHEFPRHGGFYIALWGEAYHRTQDPIFVTAIETLVNYFEHVRNPKTLALPNRNPGGADAVVCWTLSQLSLSIDIWNAAGKMPKSLASRMREACLKNDAFFLALPHDWSDPNKGIASTAEFATETAPRASAYCPTWASGYGIATNAQAAMTCYERYLQTPNAGFRALVLDAAETYLHSEPDSTIELYPGPLGDAIFLMIAAHRLTKDQRYLDRACHFADQAIPMFWDDGPLPRASSRSTHYETITRADTLARALLVLCAELNHRPLQTMYVDR